MQYFKYLGKPCNLGVHGAVTTGQVLALSDDEAEYVRNNKEFKPAKPKDEDPKAILAAQTRDITQQDRESLLVLAEQMKDDGYNINLHFGQSIAQIISAIQRAMNQSPDAFTGEYRKLYDALYEENEASILAKGALAGVAPDPKRHTKREVVAAIVRAKQEFDASKTEATRELASIKTNEHMSDDLKARVAYLGKIISKVWPLANTVPPTPPVENSESD